MTIDPGKQLPGGVLTFNEAFFDSVIRHQIAAPLLAIALAVVIFTVD